MSVHPEIDKRKTFAIISHPDAGKTTLTEKFLLFGGAGLQISLEESHGTFPSQFGGSGAVCTDLRSGVVAAVHIDFGRHGLGSIRPLRAVLVAGLCVENAATCGAANHDDSGHRFCYFVVGTTRLTCLQLARSFNRAAACTSATRDSVGGRH